MGCNRTVTLHTQHDWRNTSLRIESTWWSLMPWCFFSTRSSATAMFNYTLRPRQNGRHFPDDIFKWIFLNEIIWISMKISLKFVPRGSVNNIPALVQIMAWRRPGDKPLSEPMMIRLPSHICVTRPQWVKPEMHIGSAAEEHHTKLFTVLLGKCPVQWNYGSCYRPTGTFIYNAAKHVVTNV